MAVYRPLFWRFTLTRALSGSEVGFGFWALGVAGSDYLFAALLRHRAFADHFIGLGLVYSCVRRDFKALVEADVLEGENLDRWLDVA